MMLLRSAIVMPSILLIGLGAVGCDRPSDGPKNANMFEQLQQKTLTKRVAASSYPLMAMAESIVGEGYDVWMPAKADKVPTADEMLRLHGSDVLLTNGPGASYATWLPMVTLDQSKVFETTTDSFELSDYIQVQEHQIVHSHGAEGEHSHFWMVPHCWLNPRLALLQSEAVCDKLCELYPDDAKSFRENFANLLEGPLQDAVGDAEACQEKLKNSNSPVVLSDPRLKHFANAVRAEAGCLLWFEPEEMSAAKRQLGEVISEKGADQKEDGQHLLLWARSPGPNERVLMTGLKWIQLDLIESAHSKKGFPRRVKDNFGLLSDSIALTAEVDDEGE